MTIARQIRTRQYNQILFRYLSQAVWKRKWLFLPAMVLGGALATLIVYFNPPEYVARATFICDVPIVAQEVEHLESRDLLLRVVERLEQLKVEVYTKGFFARESEFYLRAPVALRFESFPEHLSEVEMRLDFLEGDAYELSFSALGEEIRQSGRFGERLMVGSVVFTLEPTKFWSERFHGQSIYFRLHSLPLAAAQIAKNYRVENLIQRKNRIAVFYKDMDPERAYQVLQAITDEAVKNYERRMNSSLDARLYRIRHRMEELSQLLSGREDILQILRNEEVFAENREIQAMAMELETVRAEMDRLEMRDSLREAFRETQYHLPGFRTEYSLRGLSERDSTLFRALARRDAVVAAASLDISKLHLANVTVGNAVRELQQADSAGYDGLEERKRFLEDRLMNNIGLRRILISRMTEPRDPRFKTVMYWEEYQRLAGEKYAMELESFNSRHSFTLAESPYVMNPARRFIQIRKIVSGGLIAALLVFAFIMAQAFGRNRVQSSQHLRILSSEPFTALVDEKRPDMAARRLQVAIEMERKADEKVIQVAGLYRDPRHDELVEQLAARYRASGRKVVVHRDGTGSTDENPDPANLSVQLLSPEYGERLAALSAQCDVLIHQLPPLGEYPEAWYRIRQNPHLVYLAEANRISGSDLRDLESTMQKDGIRVYFCFS